LKAKGLRRATSNHPAIVDELGRELLIRKDGSRLTRMEYGDSVIPADFSQRLIDLAKNPLGV